MSDREFRQFEDWRESIVTLTNPMASGNLKIPKLDMGNLQSYYRDYEPTGYVAHENHPQISHEGVTSDWKEVITNTTDEELLEFYDHRNQSTDEKSPWEEKRPHNYSYQSVYGMKNLLNKFDHGDKSALANVIHNAILSIKDGKWRSYNRRRVKIVGKNISNYRVMLCIDYMIECGLVEGVRGVGSAVVSHRRPSLWKPTRRLEDILETELKIVERVLGINNRESEPVIIRGKKKESINLPTSGMELVEQMRTINRNNGKHRVQLGESIISTDGTRVFNESLDFGGRIYQTDILRLNRRQRLDVTVMGEKVVEIDYTSLHPRMLHNMKGVDCPLDVYSMMCNSDDDRDLIKTTLNIILNSKNRKQAKNAIDREIRERENGTYTSADHLIDEMESVFVDISEYFYTGIGRKLQRMDSDLAVEVMLRMGELGKVCLGVHDSFITKAVDKDILTAIMDSVYEEKFGFKCPMVSSIRNVENIMRGLTEHQPTTSEINGET